MLDRTGGCPGMHAMFDSFLCHGLPSSFLLVFLPSCFFNLFGRRAPQQTN